MSVRTLDVLKKIIIYFYLILWLLLKIRGKQLTDIDGTSCHTSRIDNVKKKKQLKQKVIN